MRQAGLFHTPGRLHCQEGARARIGPVFLSFDKQRCRTMTQEPVPPVSPPPSPGATDWLFGLIVCALAFLLASTPARNSDLWLHLASGRLLAQGQFGQDPFSSTTTGVFWVNHSWLSDAALYGLHAL